MKLDTVVITGGPTPESLRVKTPGGEELSGVIALEVPRVAHNGVVRVRLEMLARLDTLTQPLVDLEFIKAAAKLHGYRLVQVGYDKQQS